MHLLDGTKSRTTEKKQCIAVETTIDSFESWSVNTPGKSPTRYVNSSVYFVVNASFFNKRIPSQVVISQTSRTQWMARHILGTRNSMQMLPFLFAGRCSGKQFLELHDGEAFPTILCLDCG